MNSDTNLDPLPTIPPPHGWMVPHDPPKKIIARKMSGICSLCQAFTAVQKIIARKMSGICSLCQAPCCHLHKQVQATDHRSNKKRGYLIQLSDTLFVSYLSSQPLQYGGLAEFGQGTGLDLAHPFAGDAQFASHLFEWVSLAIAEAEA